MSDERGRFAALEIVSGLRLGVSIAKSVTSTVFDVGLRATALGFGVAQTAVQTAASPLREATGVTAQPVSSLLRFGHSVARTSVSAVDFVVGSSLEVASVALRAVDGAIVAYTGDGDPHSSSHTGVFRLITQFVDLLDSDAAWSRLYPRTTFLQRMTAFRALLALQLATREQRYAGLRGVHPLQTEDLRAALWTEGAPAGAGLNDDMAAAEGSQRWSVTAVAHDASYEVVEAELGQSTQPATGAQPAGQEAIPYLDFLLRAMTFSYAAYGRHARTFFDTIARGSDPTAGPPPPPGGFPMDEGAAGAAAGGRAGAAPPRAELDPASVLWASGGLVPFLAGAVDAAEASATPPDAHGEGAQPAVDAPEPAAPNPAPAPPPVRHPLAYHPTFLLLVDHPTRSVLLVLRGTMSLHDLFVDLNSRPAPFAHPAVPGSHWVHEGMLDAARAVLHPRGAAVRELGKAMARWPGYELVVAGHSLGAGVGTLVALLLGDPATCLTLPGLPIPSGRRIRCLAFAPPCVASLPLSAALRGPPGGARALVTSVVVGADPVPRLCVATVRDVKRLVGELCLDRDAAARALRGGDGAADPAALAALLRRADERAAPLAAGEPAWAGARLYPAGRVLWLRRAAAGGAWAAGEVDNLEEVCGTIELGMECAGEHMPNVYEEALAALAGGE